MPEVQEQTQEQPTQTPVTQTPQTPDYGKLYSELEGKYKALESQYSEDKATLENVDSWLRTDTETAKRAELWNRSQQEKKDYNELLKSLGTSGEKPRQEAAPVFDENKLAESVMKRIQPMLSPLTEKQAEMELANSRAQLFKDEPWLTEDSYKEYETRYGKKIDEVASRIFASKGPFVSQVQRQQAQEEAYNQAHSQYAHLSERELLRLFMGDERDKAIAEGRRGPAKLPPGMVDSNLPPGKAPELLKQLRVKYAEVEGNAPKVAALCEEFASKLGTSSEEVHKLLD
jgi:hypothetical protein